MCDYIDKLEVIELADDILHIVDELRSCSQIDYHAYSELFDNLCGFDTIPSADVAPVVHGKWIEEPVTENNSMVKCSACGEYPEKKDQCFTPYCCLCGAKMDL